MALNRYEDARYTLVFVKRTNNSLPGHRATYYDLFPFVLVRFNVDENPEGPQYIETFSSNDYGLTCVMDGKNSKRYTEPLIVEDVPYWGIGTSYAGG